MAVEAENLLRDRLRHRILVVRTSHARLCNSISLFVFDTGP